MENINSCYVTGWGRRTEETDHSVILKEIAVPLWDQRKCNTALQAQFGPSYTLPNLALCAGAEGRDACDGDGGGPLVCESGGQWYQVPFKHLILVWTVVVLLSLFAQMGIVSFGIGCGRVGVPG